MSGKRYSALKQVNVNTVKNLSLRWVNTGIATGCGPSGSGPGGAPAAGGGRGGGRAAGAPAPPGRTVVGGLGTGEVNTCAPTPFGGGILYVDGVL